MSTYLEEYLDSVAALPAEIKRNFELMRELDRNSLHLVTDMETSQRSYIARAKRKIKEQATGDEDLAKLIEEPEELAAIEGKRRKAIDQADEKVAIAVQTYDLVDQHIRRLDESLSRFETQFEEEPEDTSSANRRRSRPSSTAATPRAKLKGRNGKLDLARGRSREEAGVLVAAAEDLPIDPNEPVYCFCQRVSFGQMVGCDNDDCRLEWFHFECVGLTEQPAGKWFCPECQQGQMS